MSCVQGLLFRMVVTVIEMRRSLPPNQFLSFCYRNNNYHIASRLLAICGTTFLTQTGDLGVDNWSGIWALMRTPSR